MLLDGVTPTSPSVIVIIMYLQIELAELACVVLTRSLCLNFFIIIIFFWVA